MRSPATLTVPVSWRCRKTRDVEREQPESCLDYMVAIGRFGMPILLLYTRKRRGARQMFLLVNVLSLIMFADV